MNEEGVFRLSGSVAEVEELKRQYEKRKSQQCQQIIAERRERREEERGRERFDRAQLTLSFFYDNINSW